ncbi:MAG: 1-acyl-sn-glycerol-3-phosphate acyltransferase [Clostridia bacterium]|nr:1-acyl-sn-glycerol-3-phosphate acyltransferase [Clostridia bacterium]
MNEPKAYLKHRNKLDKTFRFLFKPTIIGAENIPEDGRIILAGNHTHFMDCITVAASTKRVVHFLAKSELLEPPYKRYFEPFGIIPVHRGSKDKAALSSAIEVLEDDKVIGIFPEGKVKLKSEAQYTITPFKFGAVKMAHETGTRIVPFSITGKYKFFRKSIKIQFFEPVTVSDDLETTNNELMEIVAHGITDKPVYVEKQGETK